ncbi:CAP domain-containing protein [Lentibacillus saliphilus]|uniref:CAP domain-containing protein n=1 Tax=Lentibacillus saliphilus TaxID=2737028 RepID=UPI001C30D7A2|nr:CAP domain-containing protein [Lentibacillus saliphilus]
MKKILFITLLLLLIVLTGCMDNNGAMDDNNLNISAATTEDSSSEHPPTDTSNDKITTENTRWNPVTDSDVRVPTTHGRADRELDAQERNRPETQPTEGMNEYTSAVISLTNQERQKAGLKPLVADELLSKVALQKSQNMQTEGYFSHTSPTYGSPFEMMRQFGVTYKSAGENIAKGQPTPQEVVNAWMNSEGHRANILKPSFTHIGVGYVSNGHYWTQMFIQK